MWTAVCCPLDPSAPHVCPSICFSLSASLCMQLPAAVSCPRILQLSMSVRLSVSLSLPLFACMLTLSSQGSNPEAIALIIQWWELATAGGHIPHTTVTTSGKVEHAISIGILQHINRFFFRANKVHACFQPPCTAY